MSNHTVAITRVANSCVLLEICGHAVLTDPFFTERWHVRRGEPLGLTVDELPPLAAIVASHPYPNHWDLRGLRDHRDKAGTAVFTSSARMARQAGSLGYSRAVHLRWGESASPVPTLSVRAVAAGRNLGQRQNAYVIESGGVRVFFGGEIRDVAHLVRHREQYPAAQVALLPVNGLRPVVGPSIVMGPAEAVAGAKALGARVLVPVHDAQGDEVFSRVLRRHGDAEETRAMASHDPAAPEVLCLSTGRRTEVHGYV